MHSDNKLLLYIFNSSKEKLAKKNIKFTDKIEQISKFKLDPRYYNLINTIIRPVFNNMFQSCRSDGIELLTHSVKDGYFERDENRDWIIKIYLQGQYADKR